MTSFARKSLGAVLAAGVLLGACGGGTASLSVAPGHASPEAVLAGFIQAIEGKNLPSICQYFAPSAQSQCKSSIGSVAKNSITIEGAGIGHSRRQGDRALVVLLADKYCGGTKCYSNHDPNAGLPHGSETFTSAWNKAQSGSSKDPAAPMQLVNGKWYLAA